MTINFHERQDKWKQSHCLKKENNECQQKELNKKGQQQQRRRRRGHKDNIVWWCERKDETKSQGYANGKW